MDPIVLAAGTALVSAMATDAWQQARAGVAAAYCIGEVVDVRIGEHTGRHRYGAEGIVHDPAAHIDQLLRRSDASIGASERRNNRTGADRRAH